VLLNKEADRALSQISPRVRLQGIVFISSLQAWSICWY